MKTPVDPPRREAVQLQLLRQEFHAQRETGRALGHASGRGPRASLSLRILRASFRQSKVKSVPHAEARAQCRLYDGDCSRRTLGNSVSLAKQSSKCTAAYAKFISEIQTIGCCIVSPLPCTVWYFVLSHFRPLKCNTMSNNDSPMCCLYIFLYTEEENNTKQFAFLFAALLVSSHWLQFAFIAWKTS